VVLRPKTFETARALRLAPRAPPRAHNAIRHARSSSSALGLRSWLRPPIRRRFLGGAAESKARAIRLANQGLKCHYNGIIICEALGNGATRKPLGGSVTQSDLARRNFQLPRSSCESWQIGPHRERGRDPHSGSRNIRNDRTWIPRKEDPHGNRIGGQLVDSGDKGAESANVILAGADSPVFTRDQLVPQAHPGTRRALPARSERNANLR
jgi:hypothetical protein